MSKAGKCLLLMMVFLIMVVMFPPGEVLAADDFPSRIGGQNRYQTAVEVSKQGWDQSGLVLLARGDEYADALAGVPLACALDAPILLTRGDSLPEVTLQEIKRLGANEVIILGGTGAVSAAVENELEKESLAVERLRGENRFGTAAEIAERLTQLKGSTVMFLAYGHDFPDALAAAAYAGACGNPILLTNTDNIPAASKELLQEAATVYLVGGKKVISDDVLLFLEEDLGIKVERIGGSNRYETAVKLANKFLDSRENIYIATGLQFPDAITGAVLAAKEQTGILLVRNNVPDSVENYLRGNGVRSVTLFGRGGAIGGRVADRLGEFILDQRILYDLTLEEMLNMQMSKGPQTDKYRNEPAYVHSLVLASVGEWGVVVSDGVRIRHEPWFEDENIFEEAAKGTRVKILDENIIGADYRGSTRWYEICYQDETLYIHSSLVDTKELGVVGTGGAHIRADTNLNAHIYATMKGGAEVVILGEATGQTWNGSDRWYRVAMGTWRNATREDTLQYLDPNKNSCFQHLVLSTSAGVSAERLNRLLEGKGILEDRGDVFIEAGHKYKINEVYLVAHALLETGGGKSKLATGLEVGYNSKGELVLVEDDNGDELTQIKKTYNMFGIGAYDSNPNKCGAVYAYQAGWFTPEEAIIGGAQFIGKGYINEGRDTLYKMRWNPVKTGKQYATDVGWAVKQTYTIENLYKQLENPRVHFEIPQYRQ